MRKMTRYIKEGKVTRVEFAVATRVNIGNFESFELRAAFTIDKPNETDYETVFSDMEHDLLAEEIAYTKFLRESRSANVGKPTK